MTFFSTFTVAFGVLLTLMVAMSAWLFRMTSATLGTRLIVPAAAVALACYAPAKVNDLLGLPKAVRMTALPEKAELLAFYPHDEARVVDLWLLVADEPRAFETELSEEMKKTLREAAERIAQGRPAMLKLRGAQVGDRRGRRSSELSDFGDDQSVYVLDDSARSTLPPKE